MKRLFGLLYRGRCVAVRGRVVHWAIATPLAPERSSKQRARSCAEDRRGWRAGVGGWFSPSPRAAPCSPSALVAIAPCYCPPLHARPPVPRRPPRREATRPAPIPPPCRPTTTTPPVGLTCPRSSNLCELAHSGSVGPSSKREQRNMWRFLIGEGGSSCHLYGKIYANSFQPCEVGFRPKRLTRLGNLVHREASTSARRVQGGEQLLVRLARNKRHLQRLGPSPITSRLLASVHLPPFALRRPLELHDHWVG